MGEPRVVGRYALYDEIASGGMAAVYIGRLLGPAGFSRTVAVKCLHAQFAKDPEFVAMFLDEARLAARIRHPNVVATLDVVAQSNELFLVMEYVEGESFSRLERTTWARSEQMPLPIVSAIVTDMLSGLHAAHEATDDHGDALHIVHRDVSPHNVMVGRDGVSRVLDFGVAKAAARIQTTRDGQVKGKFAYMSPEQLTRKPVDRRTDVFAAAVVLWEALAGERLFAADDPGAIVTRVLTDEIVPPSHKVPSVPTVLDAIVMKGLSRDPDRRYATAEEMARAIESVVVPARPAEVKKWVTDVAGKALAERAAHIAEIESQSSRLDAAAPPSSRRETSQATDLSHTAPVESLRSRRTWVALAAFIVLGGGVTFALVRSSQRPAASVSNASTSSAPPTITSDLAAAIQPPATTATATATATVTANTPSTSIATTATAASAALVRRPVSTAAHTAATAATTAKVDCTTPYTFDENGVKHFKRGCL
jgi:serine/threonine-protein kinase